MRRILILEDRPAEQREIVSIINTLEEQTEVVCCTERGEAYISALEGEIDLFIVDVILRPEQPDDTSGLRFVENIRGITRYEFTPVIILTCLEDLRSYSYENLHCYAYIEKPFDTERLRRSITECLRSPKPAERERTLYYRKEGIILAVRRQDVTYALARSHRLYIHTVQRDALMIPYLTLKKFIEDAGSGDFLQISRSTVINKRAVTEVDLPGRRITMQGGERVEIGTRFVTGVREAFAGK